jgi:N-acetyltransferase 10
MNTGEGEGKGERETMGPVEEELEEAGKEASDAMREKQRAMIDSLDLSK